MGFVSKRVRKAQSKRPSKNVYISRKHAITKLQISTTDFRRLCIMKGVFPRDPPSSVRKYGAKKIYYFTKDVRFLMHEPLLHKFREIKAYAKKIQKARGRRDKATQARLTDRRPNYNLNHLVRERYPVFGDALRDLDDHLCLVFLFSAIPSYGKETDPIMQRCALLATEWMAFVARERLLTKVFLSVKGIYYQAEVQGVPITWLVPYEFTSVQHAEVDFSIMSTFTEFAEVVVRFVTFRLYSQAGLVYPPAVDPSKDAMATGISALALSSAAPDHGIALKSTAEAAAPAAAGESKAGKLSKIAARIVAAASKEDNEEEDEAVGAAAEEEAKNALLAKDATDFTSMAAASGDVLTAGSGDRSRLFEGLVFFCQRETPRRALELLVVSMGGNFAWDGPGSPIEANDASITHHVVDRPVPASKQVSGRQYVQPQWVADSVNAGIRLPAHRYIPGASLPAHLSPFVDDVAEGYVPDERVYQNKVAARVARGAPADVDTEESEAEESEAEDFQGSDSEDDGAAPRSKRLPSAEELVKVGDGEDMRVQLLSARKKRLYRSIAKSENRDTHRVNVLKSRKRKTKGKK